MGQTVHSTILDLSEGQTLGIRLQGRLTKEHKATFLSTLDQMMTEYEKVRLLLELKGVQGFDPAELWKQLNFEERHFQGCERLALVAEGDWAKAADVLCKPFLGGMAKCFSPAELRKAWVWLKR
jgi:stage II sporulation SpoAA-like protein